MMPEVTLFIEDSSIKVMTARGRKIHKWAKLSLEPGLVSDGVILDEAKVAEKVKKLLKLQKIGERTVTVGMSGFNSVYRLLALPELTPDLLPEAVMQEAGRVVPVPMDQVYTSYQQILSNTGGTKVFLAAYPRHSVDTLLATMQASGLRVSAIDLAPLALCRTVNAPKSILVNASANTLDIAIMLERVPQLIRSMSLPGDMATLMERVPLIVEEINRTVTFYNSSHTDNPLSAEVPIMVTGDLAHNPDTWQAIGGSEGYQVSAITSPMQPLEGFDASQFIVNIGLALRELTLEKEGENFSIIQINAMPHAERPQKKTSPLNIALPVVIVLGIGAMYFMYNSVRNTTVDNDFKRDQLLALQDQIPSEQFAINDLESQIGELEPVIEPLRTEADVFGDTYTSLGVTRELVDGDTNAVVKALPTDVNLIRISHQGDIVNISGNAPDEIKVFEYARALRSSGRFTMVVIVSIESETSEEEALTYNYMFSLFNDSYAE